MASVIDDVRAAYRYLGLVPFDQYARVAVEKNQQAINLRTAAGYDRERSSRGPDSPLYRGIGATTWMTVYGAVRFARGDAVHLVTQSLPPPAETLIRLLEHLTGSVARVENTRPGRQGTIRIAQLNVNDRMLIWTATSSPETVVGRVGHRDGLILRDPEFKARLVRRLRGPFEMALRVIRKEDKFLVYAEDDEFLFETTENGAISLNASLTKAP